MTEQKDHNIDQGKKREEQQSQVKPAESWLVRFRRAWEGPSNSGPAKGGLKGY